MPQNESDRLHGVSITAPADISHFRQLTILRGLGLEILGMRRAKGRSCYSIAKKEHGFKGSRQQVYDCLARELGKPSWAERQSGAK